MSTRSEELDDWLTVREVADVFRVQIGTVRNWERAGRLAAIRTPGGHRRFLRATVEALLEEKTA